MPDATRAVKRERLRTLLRGAGSVAVALSGGVDSAFLAAEAADVLGDRALAVTVAGPLLPSAQRERVDALVRARGLRHRYVEPDLLAIPEVRTNAPDRCYHCKHAIGRALLAVADAEWLRAVCDGGNADDADEHRPGLRAACELGLLSPLAEAGLGKADVRALADASGLAAWNRPADTCLATRFPHGDALTPEALRRVDAAERTLRDLGAHGPLRVRSHGGVARIEAAPDDIARLAGPWRETVRDRFRALGFAFVAVDLAGYRRGAFDPDA